MERHGSVRRGFSLSPFVILLALAIIGLLVWKVTTQISHIPAGHPMSAHYRSKFITTGVTTVLVAVALAGGIGAAGYFAFRRSERAANAGMIGVLLLFVGTFSYQAYNYLVNGPGSRGGGAPTAANSTAGAPGASDASATSPPPASRPRMAEPTPRPAASPTTPISTPPPSRPVVRPESNVPAGETPVSRPPTRPSPALPVDESEPAAQAVLDLLKAEFQAEIDAVIAAAEPVLEDVTKPPARHIGKMDDRAKAAKALKELTVKLGPRLRESQETAETKLKDAGLGASEVMHHSIRFSHDFGGFRKAMACDAVGRLCDDAIEEVEYLKANFDKWKPGRGGEVESKDMMVQSRARQLRMMLDSSRRQVDRELEELRGQTP